MNQARRAVTRVIGLGYLAAMQPSVPDALPMTTRAEQEKPGNPLWSPCWSRLLRT